MGDIHFNVQCIPLKSLSFDLGLFNYYQKQCHTFLLMFMFYESYHPCFLLQKCRFVFPSGDTSNIPIKMENGVFKKKTDISEVKILFGRGGVKISLFLPKTSKHLKGEQKKCVPF